MTKRIIKAKDIVNDIRSGLTDVQLMNKYCVSLKGLQGLYTKLVEAKAMLPEELFDRAPVLAEDSVTVESIRMMPREKIEIAIRVFDAADPKNVGRLRDVSPAGIGVQGLEARKGETRTLVLVASHLVPVDSFSFEAVCRWVKKGRAGGSVDTGFEITGISEEAKEQLKKLVQMLNFPEE